jgi:2-aminoadipate transaminase
LEGIRADPDDVVVTVGSQMALDLVTRIYCDPGDVVLAKGPSYVGALGSFAAYQARVVHVAMDAHGLVPSLLRAALKSVRPRPKFLYTVPTFHDPAGVTLSVERRAEVLAICREYGVAIVEDNPYGLLGFSGHTYPALRSLDRDVVYLGSFSKTFAAGPRGLGARPTCRARPPRAGRRIGDPLPAEFHPDAGLALLGGTRLAQPGQDAH